MKKFDSIILGTIIGISTPVLSLFVFYLYYMIKFEQPLDSYVQLLMEFRAMFYPIVSLAGLPNLLIFYLFLNKEKFKTARGVILATFIIVIAVIVIKFWD